MSESNQGPIEAKLRRLIETVDIANLLTEPLVHSINNLLRTSASNIDSDEASVLIREGEDGDLRFLTAIGEVADQLIGIKVPAGKGIAGFVFSSGQPMAVAEAGEESTFYAEVDKKTGYSTQTLLATPLRHEGEVIGVLEYVNRAGEPPYKPFTPEEMDSAALFADAVASLVGAYEAARLLRELGDKVLKHGEELEMGEIREWLGHVRENKTHRETLEIAVLLREIAGRGEAERRLCREVLESILRFSNDANETTFLAS
jgi:signal transduction protein with GAF and PtsI domain